MQPPADPLKRLGRHLGWSAFAMSVAVLVVFALAVLAPTASLWWMVPGAVVFLGGALALLRALWRDSGSVQDDSTDEGVPSRSPAKMRPDDEGEENPRLG